MNMKNQLRIAVFSLCGLMILAVPAMAAESKVPEPFQGFDNDSNFTIKYDDLSNLLKAVVVDVGLSNREKAEPTQAATGTRMKASVKRSTVNEANRFYYETFQDNKEAQGLLIGIQESLEAVPTEAPLKYFSRDEQLAYWLNLYNVTVLNQIIKEYPVRNLKKVVTGKNSFFSEKLLNVAGVPLSLDDIEFTILKNNYNSDPLIIYGLYRGYIGGPNIRRHAYNGSEVWRQLKNNAFEFINSNRGTYPKDEKTFRVSSLYERDKAFFPNFDDDLTSHLLDYIEGEEKADLQASRFIRADIDDWSVTDLGGTYRDMGASFANNNAALLNAVVGTTPADDAPAGAVVSGAAAAGTGMTLGAAAGYGSNAIAAKTQPISRFPTDMLIRLKEIQLKQENTKAENARVTVEELGEVPVDSKPASDKKDDDKDND
jgi:hypothetical protein